MKRSKIALIHRPPGRGRFSIEKVFKDFYQWENIKIIQLPVDLNSLRNAFKLFIFALKINNKYIHVAGDVHYMVTFLFWKKSIITIHDLNYYEQLTGFRKSVIGLFWFYLPLKFANKIVAISPSTKKQLLEHFPFAKTKITIIPNSFEPLKSRSKFIRRNDEKFQIICVGTAFNKNIERLFESINDMNNVELFIIGTLSLNQKNTLISYNIKYNNYSDITTRELETYFSNADLLFFASTSEGFGLPILEAQSIGLPVITSNISSMPWVAGEGAIFVNPFSINEIKEAICEIRNNKERTELLINKGYENIKRFDKERFLEQYSLLYENVFKLNRLFK